MNKANENLTLLISPSIISLPQTKQKVPSRIRENIVNVVKQEVIFNIDDEALLYSSLIDREQYHANIPRRAL